MFSWLISSFYHQLFSILFLLYLFLFESIISRRFFTKLILLTLRIIIQTLLRSSMISFHIRHLSTSLDLGYIVDNYSFLVFQFYIFASLYLSQVNKTVVTSAVIFTNLFLSKFHFCLLCFHSHIIGEVRYFSHCHYLFNNQIIQSVCGYDWYMLKSQLISTYQRIDISLIVIFTSYSIHSLL